ncbi:MAG TPA: HNH endonuclease [Kofleriaceae bacterium]|nr:HNH endonuclease [Kofleriaceae bacterium]
MLREEIDEKALEGEAAYTWAPAPPREPAHHEPAHHEPAHRVPLLDWRVVDRALQDIRHSRAALDAEEMYWLREADKLQIWRPLGLVSALDYLERVLGYAPRTAQERLRVARALGSLPLLSAALADDTLTFSAVRELTRVATPSSEAKWIADATGKNLRQIEDSVADHRPGDNPDDPPDPKARPHIVRFELNAETYALLRQTRTVLNDERGESLSDDSLIAALCNAILDGPAATEPTGRAKFQIALTLCRRCQQGWQEGSGAQIPVDRSVVERGLCDAQHIGSIDGAAPERAHQDIPPSVARFVRRRDGGRCRVDGCRSARGLELHHVIHRADGGSHEASNIILCCSSCHQAHHAGLIAISGTADNLIVQRPNSSVRRMTTTQRSKSADRPATSAPHRSPTGSASTTRAHLDAPATRAHLDAPAIPTPATHAHVDAPHPRRAPTRAHVDAPAIPTAATRAHVSAPGRLDLAVLRVEAKAALAQLGWKPAIVHTAVAGAIAALGTDVTLERLIFESLRRCPVPRA